MIAHAKPQASSSAHHLHAKFLELLPSIQRYARLAFRREPTELRQELIAEVCANCWVAFIGLMDRGLEDVIYAQPLARYAIKQVRSGRKVGTKSNINDVSSPYAQAARRIHVERLDLQNEETGQWREILLEDRHAGPAEIAATRIDFAVWLESLPRRHRKIATALAMGETTGKVAKRYKVSSGRISQLRRELKRSWKAFQGEAEADLAVA